MRIGILGGAELLASLSKKALQLTVGGSILLTLTLERGKLLAALPNVGLQLRHLLLQLFLGGLCNCRSVLCLLERPAKCLLVLGELSS